MFDTQIQKDCSVYVNNLNLPLQATGYPIYTTTQNNLVANEFLAIKTGVPKCGYIYSVYNATTKQKTGEVFYGGDYYVKVFNGVVIEWYELNYDLNGTIREFVSFETGDTPIDYYLPTSPQLCSKYDAVTDEFIVTVNYANYADIPEDKKPLLVDFDQNDRIFTYSDKSYGFVVEYIDKAYI